jgi:hypothetical protein
MAVPKVRVIPGWQATLLKMVRRGHNLRATCNAMKVGYDVVLKRRKSNPDFDADLQAALDEGAKNPKKPASF